MAHSIEIGGLTLQLPREPWQVNDCPCLHVQLPTGTPHTVPGDRHFPGLPVLPGMLPDMDNDAISNFLADLCTAKKPCILLCIHGKLVVAMDAYAVCQVLAVPGASTAEMLAMWQEMTATSALEHAVVLSSGDEHHCLGVKTSFLQELRKAYPTKKIYVTASKTVTTPTVALGLPPQPAEALMVAPYASCQDTLEKLRNGTVQATLAGLPPVHLATQPQPPRTLLGQASPPVPALWGERRLAVLTVQEVGGLVFTLPESPPFQLELPAGLLNLEQLADAVQQGTGCAVTFEILGSGLQVTAEVAGLTVTQPGHPALALLANTPVQLPHATVGLALRGPLFLGSPDHGPALEAAGFTVTALDSTQIAAVHVPSIRAMLVPLNNMLGRAWEAPLHVSIPSIHDQGRPAQLRLTGSTEATGLQVLPPETVCQPAMAVELKPPTKYHAQLLKKLLPRNAAGEMSLACSMHELQKLAQDLFALPVEAVQQALEQESFPGGGQRLAAAQPE